MYRANAAFNGNGILSGRSPARKAFIADAVALRPRELVSVSTLALLIHAVGRYLNGVLELELTRTSTTNWMTRIQRAGFRTQGLA